MTYIPLKMHPWYKEYLWGGTRLKRDFHKADAPAVTAESWELADLPDGQSTVERGRFQGQTISQLGKHNQSGFWGTNCENREFPLLVKLIDAKKDLSIQVHPSNETADPKLGEQGKAEMWYIVDCEPKSSIYLGFSERISRETFLRKARNGTICEVLNCVPVTKGDAFYISPGTIHAIQAGIVIAEIQQSSNTTFRVYDYQRRGTDGRLRPLHLERAAEVLNYDPIMPRECRANSVITFPEFTMAEMYTCSYFRAYRIDVHPEVTLRCDEQSFQHILCVEGDGAICHQSIQYPIRQGESYFLPASLGEYQITGHCRVLLSRI